MGRARPNRALSIDEDNHIWCETPPYAHFTYWDDAARTAEAWRRTPTGWEFTVGDLGRLVDGYLYLEGRRDDLIISGGVNVYPAEVELELRQVPGVDQVAVFGSPDEEWGQAVTAVVVPSDPSGGGEQLIEAVVARARQTLAAYKRPKRVLLADALPVSSTGKLRRSTLADDLRAAP